MKYSIRSLKTGRFISRSTPARVVNGRLYEFKGAVVRARQIASNGKRIVSYHKTLTGLVEDEDLRLVSRDKVKEYLKKA